MLLVREVDSHGLGIFSALKLEFNGGTGWERLSVFYLNAAGNFLIGIWLLIVVGLVAAFLVSFYFSGSTIIYCLLRREVDATDIEDVYLEEDQEELTEAPSPEVPPQASEGKPVEPEGTEEKPSSEVS